MVYADTQANGAPPKEVLTPSYYVSAIDYGHSGNYGCHMRLARIYATAGYGFNGCSPGLALPIGFTISKNFIVIYRELNPHLIMLIYIDIRKW